MHSNGRDASRRPDNLSLGSVLSVVHVEQVLPAEVTHGHVSLFAHQASAAPLLLQNVFIREGHFSDESSKSYNFEEDPEQDKGDPPGLSVG